MTRSDQSIEISVEDTGPGRPEERLPPRADEDLSGRVLSRRYRLIRQLGRGGMGAVYLARHIALDKRFAIKMLSSSYATEKHATQRFIREARATSQLRHENIVDVCDFGISGGRVYLVMEYLEGEDLAATVRRDGPMPWRRVARILLQVCAALQAAHARRIVHRDIKPGNCFRVTGAAREDFIKVLDFGVAKVLGGSAADGVALETDAHIVVGTPEYLAPESFGGGQIDGRVDVYAVGMLGFHLLTGKLPFSRASPDLVQQICAGVARSPRAVMPRLMIPEVADAIVMRALRPSPRDRFQTISDLGAAIASVLEPSTPLPIASSVTAAETVLDAVRDDEVETRERRQVRPEPPRSPWGLTLLSSGAAAVLAVALGRLATPAPESALEPSGAATATPIAGVEAREDVCPADDDSEASKTGARPIEPARPIEQAPPIRVEPPPPDPPPNGRPASRPRRRSAGPPAEPPPAPIEAREAPATPPPDPLWRPASAAPKRSDLLRPGATGAEETTS